MLMFQHSKIRREKKSGEEDYYLPSFMTYVNLDDNQDWALVNLESNIQQMFDKLKEQYCKPSLQDIKYIVKWDKTEIISDCSSFKIFENHNEILVCTEAMTRPRIQLISVLLHALLHIYLSVCSKGEIKMNHHDESFRKIMLFLNEKLNTQLTVGMFRNAPISRFHFMYFRRLTSCRMHLRKLSIPNAGISVPASVKHMSLSTVRFIANRFRVQLIRSGRSTKMSVAVNTSRFSRCKDSTTKLDQMRRNTFVTSTTCSQNLANPF